MIFIGLATNLISPPPKSAMQIVGDVGDRTLVASVIKDYQVDAIVHFAASSIVAEFVADPLGYHHNNTINSHALIAAAVNGGVRQFIFSSTAAMMAILRAFL